LPFFDKINHCIYSLRKMLGVFSFYYRSNSCIFLLDEIYVDLTILHRISYQSFFLLVFLTFEMFGYFTCIRHPTLKKNAHITHQIRECQLHSQVQIWGGASINVSIFTSGF